MEDAFITRSHFKEGNRINFQLYECDTPYELIIWTDKPLNVAFTISYELKKYIHGQVRPFTQITDYIELNTYHELSPNHENKAVGLYKSRTLLCNMKEYFDKSLYKYGTHNISLNVDPSSPESIKGMSILAYRRVTEKNF
jgi:hypothetical protein